MKPTRLEQITRAQAAAGGKAFLLTMAIMDGTEIALEIESDKLPIMISVLLKCAQQAGEHAPPTLPLKDTPPSKTVPIPSEEFATTSTPGGGLWLMFRAGSVDLSVALPDPRSSQALADALLHPD